MNSHGLYVSNTHYASGRFRLSHEMSALSDNLSKRRAELKLSVPDVTASLQRKGIEVAYSTVAAWFNGGRKPKDMEHLKALCAILDTSISEMAGEDPEFAQNAFEAKLLEETRGLDPVQREAIMAIIASMRPKAAPQK